MKKNTQLFLFLLMGIFLGNCSNQSEPEVKPQPAFEIKNNFSTPIAIEIYSGRELKYENGKIRGYNLLQKLNLNEIIISGSSKIELDKDENYIIVFGRKEGIKYFYLTSLRLNNPEFLYSYSFNANGSLTQL